jgi:hypothetical protein
MVTTSQISFSRYKPFTDRIQVLGLIARPSSVRNSSVFKKMPVSKRVDICLHFVYTIWRVGWTQAATLRFVYLLSNENLFKIQR